MLIRDASIETESPTEVETSSIHDSKVCDEGIAVRLVNKERGRALLLPSVRTKSEDWVVIGGLGALEEREFGKKAERRRKEEAAFLEVATSAFRAQIPPSWRLWRLRRSW